MKRTLEFVVILLLLNNNLLFAQVSAQLDSNTMLIGDQMNLILSATTSKQSTVLFPTICDTCIEGVEILNKTIDTFSTNEQLVWKQTLRITSFNEGNYTIEPFAIYDQDSNLLGHSNALQLQINTLPIDTSANIKDIKAPLSEPITLKEILNVVMWILLVAIGIGLIIFGIYKFSKRKKTKDISLKSKPTEPAHIIALRDLEQLHQKRLWQNGHIKEYYSLLSEICRTYMYNRWDIAAMEMVNEEIETSLQQIGLEHHIITMVIKDLQACDLAKFAKHNPLPDENAAIYKNMVDFVNNTKETIANNNEIQH